MEIMTKFLPDNEADNVNIEAFYQCKPIYWESMQFLKIFNIASFMN